LKDLEAEREAGKSVEEELSSRARASSVKVSQLESALQVSKEECSSLRQHLETARQQGEKRFAEKEKKVSRMPRKYCR